MPPSLPCPKLAATIAILRKRAKKVEVLLGKRSPKHQFMPSVYVFPGGVVEDTDAQANTHGNIDARTQTIMQEALSLTSIRACAVAAIRESFEETRIILGNKANNNMPAFPYAHAFNNTGHLPDLSPLTVFGRAITPPARGHRFNTWFFIYMLDENKEKNGDYGTVTTSTELTDVQWVALPENINDIKLPTPTVTKIMLMELNKYIDDSLSVYAPNLDIVFVHAPHKTSRMERFPNTMQA